MHARKRVGEKRRSRSGVIWHTGPDNFQVIIIMAVLCQVHKSPVVLAPRSLVAWFVLSARANLRRRSVFIAVEDGQYLSTRCHRGFRRYGVKIARTVLHVQCCIHATNRAVSCDNAREYLQVSRMPQKSNTSRAEEVMSPNYCGRDFLYKICGRTSLFRTFLMFRLARRKLWRARCD